MVRISRASGRRKSAPTEDEQTPSPTAGTKNRLSKPKGLGFANSAATLSKHSLNTPADGYERVVESSTGHGRSKQPAGHTLRSQSCGPEDREAEHGLCDDEPLGGPATHVKGKLSRSGSQATRYLSAKGSVSQLTNSSQTSLVPESRAIDLEAAVAILQELRKTASPEDLVALHRALLPTSSPEQNPTAHDAPIPYSSAAVIRHKSLATPGVATRRPSLQEEKKEPPPEDVQLADEHLWRPSHRRIAHFSRLSTVESVDESLDAAARAGTPGSMEYAHLGTHKLGSLIVMNASASPSSSIASKTRSRSKSTADLARDEDFFTASEGEGRPSSVEDNDFGAPLPQRQYSDLDGLPSQRERIGRLTHRFMTSANPAARSGSPLKHQVREQSEECDDVDILLGPPSTQPTPANITSTVLPSTVLPSTVLPSTVLPSTVLPLEDMSDDEPGMPKVSPAGSQQSALSLAREYIADLPPSPYASTVDVSQYSEVESEATQRTHDIMQTDEGFYDASPEFEEPSQEFFEEPDPSQPFTREITPETALRSHPLRDMPLKPALKPSRPSAQTKSDSGYSSEYDSLRSSARSDQRPPINHPVVATYQYAPNSPEDAIAMHTFRQTPPNSGPEGALQSLQGWERSANPEPTPSKAPARSKSWRESVRKSLPRLLSSESATSLESTHSFDSKSTAKEPKQQKQQKKLQKKRPLSQQPISASFPRHLENGNVPRVPSEVSSRFTVRLATSPNMEHLERTYESVSAHESTGPDTIYNKFAFADPDKVSRLVGNEPPPTPPHRYGLGARGNQRRSNMIDDDDDDGIFTGVVDFGTVAQSPGSSPYDVSTSGFRRQPLSAAATHPYQLSSLTPQSGPRRGWDDETAMRIAQMRIHERVAAATASMNEHSMNARPGLPGRPRSHHGSSGFTPPHRIPSRGSDIGIPQRPRSMYSDTSLDLPVMLDLPVIPPRQGSAPFGHEQSIPRYETSNFEPERIPLPEPARLRNMPAPGMVAQLASQIDEAASAPVLPPSNSTGWSHQANVWRKRKLAAQTTVGTTRSPAPLPHKATTITNTAIAPYAHIHPQQHAQQKPTTRYLPYHPSFAKQLHQASASTSATQDEQSISTLPTYAEEGMFGRYGGGARHGTQYRGFAGTRDVSLATGGLREEWGIDLGDVPAARLAP